MSTAPFTWPLPRLGELLELLAARAGMAVARGAPPIPPAGVGSSPTTLARWIDGVSLQLGMEAVPAPVIYRDLFTSLRTIGPALFRITVGGEPGFVAILSGGRHHVQLLAPDLRVLRLPYDRLRAVLCRELEEPLERHIAELLAAASIPPAQRARARQGILDVQLEHVRCGEAWLLRYAPTAGLLRQMGQLRLGRRLALLIALHLAQYVLWVASWGLIGHGVLDGRIDLGWLLAWGLMLVTVIPLRLASSWCQGSFAIAAGGLLKQRLLSGALRMGPEEMRLQGAGQIFGRTLELAALENLALAGGALALLALLECAVAGGVLALGDGGPLHAVLLALWLAVMAFTAWQYLRRARRWAAERLAMTEDLIERIVGYRTRMIQQGHQRWHDGEDQQLEHYVDVSVRMDRWLAAMTALIPRGWLVVGLLWLAPELTARDADVVGLAIALGGVLLAYRALTGLARGLLNLADAVIAWQQVAPIYRAAERQEPTGTPNQVALSLLTERPAGTSLLRASNITYRYPSRPDPALAPSTFEIRVGDRILLEGRSGSGKSTVASLLAGVRTADAGVILCSGVDRPTLGSEAWRRHVVAAPQFHENYLVNDSLLFNVLMGRRWPASLADLEAATAILEELGLGPLLRRMPAGVHQIVGETGWQLSHGERSRVYMARALLHGAELVILDESFAALDPETLDRAMDCALAHARSLIVIAHP